MKVLLVADFTQQPCGISNFAHQTLTALRRHPGVEVTAWDGNYPKLYARREAGEPTYLPADAASYDVIHVNWHPIAFNTYTEAHFPGGPLLSVYLHDTPQWTACPFHQRADVRFTSEPWPDCHELPYPCADWIDLPRASRDFIVGCPTLRGDGLKEVAAICHANHWSLRTRPLEWLPFDQDVQQLARNTVNVLWYHEKRGKSGGLSQAISARRPVICSGSEMFSHFWDYRHEIYFSDDLEDALQLVYHEWEAGCLTRPLWAADARSWTRATEQMVAAWEGARR